MKVLTTVVATVAAHARLMEPPGRSSLYLLPNDEAVAEFWDLVIPNYADNQLFCGGLQTQIANDYKCGVCGDNYKDQRPRENELGGKWGRTGIIPRTYQAGELIPLVVQVTAHHQGWFEFRVCSLNGAPYEDEDCFADPASLLTFTDGSTRYDITDQFPTRKGKSGHWFEMEAYLPQDLECEHCVLQWRYHCGNSWGSDETGSGIGKGYQEEFYGCADLTIGEYDGKPTQRPIVSETPTSKTTTTKPEYADDVDSFCLGKSGDLYPLPECDQFLHCSNGVGHIKTCPEGLLYNPNGFCDWPENVQCKENLFHA